MPDRDSAPDYELADQLAEEFALRYARGERPAVQEYCDRHPELAGLLRDLLPAMVQLEQAKEGLAGGEDRPAAAPPARQLGDFHLLREIGRGGMGVVYEAEQLSLGRRVALKVLPQQHLPHDRQKQRFEREAKAAAKLHHTNIVPVFGSGEHDGTPYYVMQLIRGVGLDAVVDELARMGPGSGAQPAAVGPAACPPEGSPRAVAQSLLTGTFHAEGGADSGATRAAATGVAPVRPAVQGPVEPVRADTSGGTTSVTLPGLGQPSGARRAQQATYWQSVARVGVQVAEALEHAHRQGVVHRDIKPSNLLLDMHGTVWVTDFGLAKAEGGEDLTRTGDVLGTLRYMPPEAFDGKADGRGDVYSLGLTLYELVALRPAFDERDRNRLIKQVTTAEPEPLSRARRGVPRDLETILHKAAERDPGRRYPSAAELAADLRRFANDEPIKARRHSALEQYRRWVRHNPAVALLATVLLAVLTAATVTSLAVARRMTALAQSEARAAEDERQARRAAEGAKERQAKLRAEAEAARQDADGARAKAEAGFAKARQAVDDYFTMVSQSRLLRAPGTRPLRQELLQAALGFYEEFLRERAADPSVRAGLAAA